MTNGEELSFRVVTKAEFEAWPVDRSRDGTLKWAESTWGKDAPGRPKLFNWNIWGNRLVIEVGQPARAVRCEALWRRSSRSIRQRGLKLTGASQAEEIRNARVVQYDQERVIIDFEPVNGAGLYHLYYGASDAVCFAPDEEWLRDADKVQCVARAMAIESRCALDSFYPMAVIALESEKKDLLTRFSEAEYLVFPEDRDRPIQLTREIPAHWARQGPAPEIDLTADQNEYRVFQLGVWACRKAMDDVKVVFSDATDSAGNILPARRFQCLTLETRMKSQYIIRPPAGFPIPKGAIRALWCGVDLPDKCVPGRYCARVTVSSRGLPETSIPLTLTIGEKSVPERGDHDLTRLSRLRWIESDVGLSDKVYPPYKPLKWAAGTRSITTWGHVISLGANGLPRQIRFGNKPILARPIRLDGNWAGQRLAWKPIRFTVVENTPGHIAWEAISQARAVSLAVKGRIEYDGCIVLDTNITPEKRGALHDLRLSIEWAREHAALASGMGYRGQRIQDRVWRKHPQGTTAFTPSVWMGSIQAGLGFATWETTPWEEAGRTDAISIIDRNGNAKLTANLGQHALEIDRNWTMRFALLPTPVKPVDSRHWDFRYLHKGGDFMPTDEDTPQSFLAQNCRRLDELKAMGVRRLNLHDWWGPAFNYAWQWEGPDNLARLCQEAHRRGMYVKVYQSGRELSSLAPEFWAILFEGAGYDFSKDTDDLSLAAKMFQDAWHENHLPDGLPQGWPRVPPGCGNEHAVPVSNATRNGNFYLESMRYMTRFFGTDGAYWDGADGPTLGHRDMAKRLWVMFKQNNRNGVIDVHHGHAHSTSPISDHMLVFPFIDSIWHGEGFDYERFDPWEWLVEISGLPFNIPSEVLGGDAWFARGLLFGIWSRAGWCAGTEKQAKLWAFFDTFGIKKARMIGFWEKPHPITVNRPVTYATVFKHPRNGIFVALATWHEPLATWMREILDVTLHLDRKALGLPAGRLRSADILTGEALDIDRPVPLPNPKEGRLLWIRK